MQDYSCADVVVRWQVHLLVDPYFVVVSVGRPSPVGKNAQYSGGTTC